MERDTMFGFIKRKDKTLPSKHISKEKAKDVHTGVEMMILYTDGIPGEKIEEFARNVQYAMGQSNLQVPIYISRAKWSGVSSDDLNIIRKELNELYERYGDNLKWT